jgi:hypothetical protein
VVVAAVMAVEMGEATAVVMAVATAAVQAAIAVQVTPAALTVTARAKD